MVYDICWLVEGSIDVINLISLWRFCILMILGFFMGSPLFTSEHYIIICD